MRLPEKEWNNSVKQALHKGYTILFNPDRVYGYTSGKWDHARKLFILSDVNPRHRKVLEGIIESFNTSKGNA